MIGKQMEYDEEIHGTHNALPAFLFQNQPEINL